MLIFEKSRPGRSICALPENDVPVVVVSEGHKREKAMHMPEMAEVDLGRHYTELAKKSHGVNDGFYPLGSCTMKYNPRINEEMAGLAQFTDIHPLQPANTVQGCLEVIKTIEEYLCEITGMDAMTVQPAAGAHGEFTGLLLIKAYHESRGDKARTKIIVPDSAHGTNPASATMAGYSVVSVPSGPDGCVDIEKLREAVGPDTAGLMLTNPNTVGLFDKNILEITKIIHECGGLCYYDGANLNAVMGVVRPGDMGFDVIHLNLHKTFSTPHGGGGPGAGPVGCKAQLAQFMPSVKVVEAGECGCPAAGGAGSEACPAGSADKAGIMAGHGVAGLGMAGATGAKLVMVKPEESIGEMKSFYGNFLVVVRALTYIMTLGKEGIPEASKNAVLNANYMMNNLKDIYQMAYDEICMHEFVMSLDPLKKETGISAMDIAKGLLDFGIHPPTMYFPLIVHEALMVEPTETESKETLDHAIEVLRHLYDVAHNDAQALHNAPVTTPVTRMDEVGAARNPVLTFKFE